MDTLERDCRGASTTDVSPALLAEWMREGSVCVIDVREDFERAAEYIDGSDHVPISGFDVQRVRELRDGRRVVFHCRGGKRSAEAARRFEDDGEPVFQLAGGIEAWKQAGLPVERSGKAPVIDVMRQVQMIAGSLILGGVLLGAFLSPWWLIMSGFVGAGLLFAGLTGWCGMAVLLARMPWNRIPGGTTRATCTPVTTSAKG